uniref:Uncharacterized protein n=1 Tax=Pyxicephalus adspersus TaxID=30357 RepID=A0AAV3AUF8_PYXAD|nr:TPA: hypothetical protein GDO54_010052 [Pyxicephalus adspersus]
MLLYNSICYICGIVPNTLDLCFLTMPAKEFSRSNTGIVGCLLPCCQYGLIRHCIEKRASGRNHSWQWGCQMPPQLCVTAIPTRSFSI